MRARTRSQWEEYYRNWHNEKKNRDGGSTGVTFVINVVKSEPIIIADGGGGNSLEKQDFVVNGEKRGGDENIDKKRTKNGVEEFSGSRDLSEHAGETIKEENDNNEDSDSDSDGSYGVLEYLGEEVVSCSSNLKVEAESSSSDEDDEFLVEDYKADEALASESSDASCYGTDVEKENDDGDDASTTEQEKADESDHGSHCLERSAKRKLLEDLVMIINDKVESPNVWKSTVLIGEKESDDVEADKRDHSTNDYGGENQISANNWKKEDVVVFVDDDKRFPGVRRSARINRMGGGELIYEPLSKHSCTDKAREDGDVNEEVEKKLNRLKKRKAFALEILADSDKQILADLGLITSPAIEYLQSSKISKSQKKECGEQWSEKEQKLGMKKTRAERNVDLLNILMESINLLKERKFPIDENVFVYNSLPLKFRFEDEVEPPVEKSEWEKEIDSLFLDLELGLRESEMDYDSSSMEIDEFVEIDTSPAAGCGRGEHQPILDEEIGMVCKYCAAVILDIKYVLPPFYRPPLERRDRKDLDFSPSSNINKIHFQDSAYGTPDSISRAKGTVWDLIPGIEKEMYPHQCEGFEFMWKNIGGGIFIEKLKKPLTDGGRGCIISHAPGTGKTRLTIVFLATFLKMYPTCRPVIIAPKGMLLTWQSEFIKWNINIPFHNMNNVELSPNEDAFAAKILGLVGGGTISKDHIRWLKLCTWMQGGSILGISYPLFEKLAGGNGKGEEMKKMRELLLQYPGLLVLDEGHTPRNDRSLIWKVLTKVATRRCVILSGTPFQNNLAELYNTLCLVNPTIVNQNVVFENSKIYRSCGRKGGGGRSKWRNLTSCISKDDGLKKMKAMLDPFVHVYKGTILEESLPGLRDTLVFLHPTKLQKKLLETCTKANHIFHRIRLVSMVSVHPSLFPEKRRFKGAHRKSKDEEIESDVNAGVKMQFVMKLIWLADALGERVLIFSQFIDPLKFIKKLIKSHFSWNEGRELLYMDGKLDERQRQDSISSFNDFTSEAKVLLASERACSEGINLVGASRVVLIDTVWNPSVEKQAISRAYRLGQKKVVYVYRLFTSGTEVRQYAQQIHKERISQLIFSPGDGLSRQCDKSNAVHEDKVLEAMLGLERFNHIFEKIIHQPKESDLIEIFGLLDLK